MALFYASPNLQVVMANTEYLNISLLTLQLCIGQRPPTTQSLPSLKIPGENVYSHLGYKGL